MGGRQGRDDDRRTRQRLDRPGSRSRARRTTRPCVSTTVAAGSVGAWATGARHATPRTSASWAADFVAFEQTAADSDFDRQRRRQALNRIAARLRLERDDVVDMLAFEDVVAA